MATAFGSNLTDLARAMDAQTGRQNERALAAMQLLASTNQTAATRYGADRTLDAARLREANESMRLGNLMTLGREQYGSQERVAGLGYTSAENIARGTAANEATRLQNALDLGREGNTSAENIERMRGANQLAVAKWNAMLQDPRYASNMDQLDAEIEQLNTKAKIAAAKANFALQSGIDGATKWGGFAKKTLTPAELATLASGIWNSATDEGAGQMFYNGTKFEPIVMPKAPRRGASGFDSIGLPAVPPLRPNQSLMAPPSYGAPPMSYDGSPVVPPLPNRAMMDASVPIGSVPVVPPGAAGAAPTNAVPITSRIAADFTNTRLPPMARPTIDEAFIANLDSPMSYLPGGGTLLNGIRNAYQSIQGYGSIPKADPTAFGAQGSAPGYRLPTGSVAVPTATTNAPSGQRIFNDAQEAVAAGIQPGQEFLYRRNGEVRRGTLIP